MKKIKFLILLLLISKLSNGQIEPFWGIYNIDSCDFESSCSLISIDTSNNNIWEIGTPSKPYFDSAYSSNNAIVTDTLNPYIDSSDSYFDLIIPAINNYEMYFNLIIGFKHKYNTDTLVDGGYIDISYDMGQNWVNIIYDDTAHFSEFFSMENMYTQSDTIKGGINGFSGTSNDWIHSRIQWVWAFPVKSIIPDTLMLRFHFISDGVETNKDGWIIDNINLQYAELPAHINEFEPYNTFAFPNPLEKETTIIFERKNGNICNFKMFDAQGRIVKEIIGVTSNEIKIIRGNLISGLYFYQILSENNLVGNGKLVVK